MPDENPALDYVARGMLDEDADLAETRIVGSGISTTRSISIDFQHDPGMLERFPAPWTENRDMIVALFTPIFERSLQCPGRDDVRCCQAEGEQACWPNWQEREDPEWYAQKINMLLSQVNERIAQQAPTVPALAADEGFELGCLFTEALIKFRWDQHAKAGQKSSEGGKLGQEMLAAQRPLRKTASETLEIVEALCDSGMKKMAAYRKAARQQGVGVDAIRLDCRVAKKTV